MSTDMPRTLITLSASEMRWLKRMSVQKKVSMASIVREAIVEYRVRIESTEAESSLLRTAGLWRRKGLDAAAFVDEVRAEWDR